MPRTRLTPQQIAVREYIRLFGKLSKRIDIECRVIEAHQLLTVTREFGTNEQKNKVFKTLRHKENLQGIRLACRCRDNGCSWWGGSAGVCSCLGNESLNCAGLYVFGQNGEQIIIAPSLRSTL
jgi:hypothetical protein